MVENQIKEYLGDIKEGRIRGDSREFRVDEDVVVHISVADFQFGDIVLMVFVECEVKEPREDMHYRVLHGVSGRYERIRSRVVRAIESENECDVRNAHEWQISDPYKAVSMHDSGLLPEGLNPETTHVYMDYVQIRDDVSMAEAIMTNRREGERMTRSEVEEEFEDKD